ALGSRDPRTLNAEGKRVERGIAKGRGRPKANGRDRIQTAEDKGRPGYPGDVVGRVPRVEPKAELVLPVDRQIHDDRLDEHLSPRLIEFVDARSGAREDPPTPR